MPADPLTPYWQADPPESYPQTNGTVRPYALPGPHPPPANTQANAEAYHQSGQSEGPTAQDAISAIINTEGNLDFAAERLFGHKEGVDNKARLIALITEDPSAQGDLQRILRTLAMLQAFSTFKEVSMVVGATLDKLDPNQRARFMTTLLTAINMFTDDHTQTTNINARSTSLSVAMSEQVFKSLPPDVQQAIKALQAPPETEAGVG
jgi:hypothetical protein